MSRLAIRGGEEWSKGSLGHNNDNNNNMVPTASDATKYSTRGFLHYFRTTLSLILLSMLVVIGGTSVYLQYRQFECIHDDRFEEALIHQPPVLKAPIVARSITTPFPNAEKEEETTIAHVNYSDPAQSSRQKTRMSIVIEGHPVPILASQSIPQVTANTTEEEETVKTNVVSEPNRQEPILVYSNMGFNREEPCDIPCVYTSNPDDRLKADASVYERRGYVPPDEGDRFSIYLQMEGEHYYPISLEGYHLENSYRWVSPLLKPYFEWIHYQGAHNISNPPVSFHSTRNGASFIARNCASLNNRESVVLGLRKAGIRVDGLSDCLSSNRPRQTDDKLAMMKPYKFNLAFENGNVQDYVTEKVYQALAAGVVPVYLGAPNVREYVPDHSIINVADFAFNTNLLAQHLKDCMNNQSLYESYHAWRFRPLPDWFVQKFNFTWDTTECRTCRYIHAHKNGWKWDKFTQRGIPPKR